MGDLLFSGGGRLALFSRRRKCRRCCAFLESDMVFGGPGEILRDVHAQEFSAADSLHSRAVDGQWGVVSGVPPPEVQHKLLCLLHIEGQIVSATPFSQLCHFLCSAFHRCC